MEINYLYKTIKTVKIITLFVNFLIACSINAGLYAGAARSTPPLGTIINGGVMPGYATYINDELYAKAIVLDNGSNRLALVVVDTCLFDRSFCDETKKLIQEKTGIKPEQIMISATHTHSGGAITAVHLSEADLNYRKWLLGKITEAVELAISNLIPAKIGYISTNVYEHVFCRRILIKPGFVYTNQLGKTKELAKMNWDSPHPADYKPAGPIDPEFFIVSIKSLNNKPIAVIANYSLHYVGGVPAGHISADYYGVYAEKLKHAINADSRSPEFIAILCNGTSGDINNINFKERKQFKPYEQMENVAVDLVTKTLQLINSIKYYEDVRLDNLFTNVTINTRLPDKKEIEQAKAIIDGRPLEKLRGWLDNYAREQILLSEYPASVSVPVQIFRIGGIVIAGWAGEVFASSGIELKSKSPIKPLFNIGLANGYFGYIPPPEQFNYGAYETWNMRTSYLETNAIPKLIDAYLKLIYSL